MGSNFNCVKSSGTGGGTGGDSGLLGGGGSTTNGLGNTYPAGLVVESPYSSGNAVEGLLKTRSQQSKDPIPTTDISFSSFDERQKEIIDRIGGKTAGDCKVQLGLFRRAIGAQCYGPSVNYSVHPTNGSSGMLPSGDLGIWTENENYPGGKTEPCVIAKLQSLLSELKGQADTSLDLFAAMLCYAKVQKADTLPALNESLDLASVLGQGFKDALIPAVVTAASIKRDENNADGDAQFLSNIEMAVTGPLGKSVTMSLNLKHVVQSTDHSKFKGRLQFVLSGNAVEEMGGNCGTKSELSAGAMTYEKTNTNLNYQLRRARYCDKTKAAPFNTEGQLDAGNLFAPGNLGGWADGFFDIRSRIQLSDITGSIGVSWQAGKNDFHTRNFVANIGITSGIKSGCGYFGYGPSASSTNLGEIDGMVCNWAGPGGYISQPSDTARASIFQNDKVQRQCVTYNKTNSTWESETLKLNIDYGPTNACTWLSGTVDGRTFISNDLFDVSTDTSITNLAIPDAPSL